MTDSTEHHLSKDGSSTLYSSRFKQFYHNPNGAISESRHVFFETPGVTKAIEAKTDSLTIFETGFGTGLNFILFLEEYLKENRSFPAQFYSVEAFPVDLQTVQKTNYARELGNDTFQVIQSSIFSRLRKGWNSFKPIEGVPVTLHVFIGFFDELDTIEHQADFFFHDPFSPEVNEELWTTDTFSNLKSFAKPDAVLATYCAASKARAAMAKANWFVARAPGALGKREMTVASLSGGKLAGFKRVNEKRLTERLDKGDFE